MTKAEESRQKVGVIESARSRPMGTKLEAERPQFSSDTAMQCLCDF